MAKRSIGTEPFLWALFGLLCYGGAVVGSAIAAGFLLGPIPR